LPDHSHLVHVNGLRHRDRRGHGNTSLRSLGWKGWRGFRRFQGKKRTKEAALWRDCDQTTGRPRHCLRVKLQECGVCPPPLNPSPVRPATAMRLHKKPLCPCSWGFSQPCRVLLRNYTNWKMHRSGEYLAGSIGRGGTLVGKSVGVAHCVFWDLILAEMQHHQKRLIRLLHFWLGDDLMPLSILSTSSCSLFGQPLVRVAGCGFTRGFPAVSSPG